MQKIIVFDMDGVLFDSTHFAQEEMCRLYPGLTSEIMKEMNCGNWHEEVKKLTIPRIEETKEEVEQGRVAYAEKKSNAPIFDGVVNLLDKFHKAGYKIILNTSVSARNCLLY